MNHGSGQSEIVERDPVRHRPPSGQQAPGAQQHRPGADRGDHRAAVVGLTEQRGQSGLTLGPHPH